MLLVDRRWYGNVTVPTIFVARHRTGGSVAERRDRKSYLIQNKDFGLKKHFETILDEFYVNIVFFDAVLAILESKCYFS